MRAYQALKYDLLELFVWSVIELKFDQSSTFVWQNHNKDQREVPWYTNLLDVTDLHAQALENIARDEDWKYYRGKKIAVNSYVLNIQDSCVACNGKHQVHKCGNFRTMSHDREMAIVKKNAICINCLRPGHFLLNCPIEQRCKECRKAHHLLMHIAHPNCKEKGWSEKNQLRKI